MVETDHPHAGRLRQMRNAARFEGTPADLRRGAPALGEHSAEILAEAGYSADEITGLKADGIIGIGLERRPHPLVIPKCLELTRNRLNTTVREFVEVRVHGFRLSRE